MPTDPEQEALLARLANGELGPWGAQGFIPGGITIMRPDGQWENIYYTPGDANLTYSEQVGEPVDVSGLELDESYEGTFLSPLGGAIGTSTGAGGPGHVLASVIAADSYGDADFVRTSLGEIRHTEGSSNGVSGPLSPVRMGEKRNAVDRDGNPWFPVVRFHGVDAERSGGGTGGGRLQ